MKIYFIRVGRAVKIGYSGDVYTRCTILKCGTYEPVQLLAFVEGDKAAEKALHKRFSAFHMRGEFFRYTGDLRDYIKSLPKMPLTRPIRPRVQHKGKNGKKERTLSPDAARKFGAEGGKEKGRRARGRRMAERDAKRLWRSPDLTTDEALELMHLWTRETAYRYLGRRNTPRGRRPKE